MSISHSIRTEISKKNSIWKYRVEIGKILRKICERMDGVEIIKANACIDQLNLLC